jgi:hypothetical protein
MTGKSEKREIDINCGQEWIQLNQTLVSSNNARATTHALQGSRAHEVFQIAY